LKKLRFASFSRTFSKSIISDGLTLTTLGTSGFSLPSDYFLACRLGGFELVRLFACLLPGWLTLFLPGSLLAILLFRINLPK
jgi:hypothetical protein